MKSLRVNTLSWLGTPSNPFDLVYIWFLACHLRTMAFRPVKTTRRAECRVYGIICRPVPERCVKPQLRSGAKPQPRSADFSPPERGTVNRRNLFRCVAAMRTVLRDKSRAPMPQGISSRLASTLDYCSAELPGGEAVRECEGRPP